LNKKTNVMEWEKGKTSEEYLRSGFLKFKLVVRWTPSRSATEISTVQVAILYPLANYYYNRGDQICQIRSSKYYVRSTYFIHPQHVHGDPCLCGVWRDINSQGSRSPHGEPSMGSQGSPKRADSRHLGILEISAEEREDKKAKHNTRPLRTTTKFRRPPLAVHQCGDSTLLGRRSPANHHRPGGKISPERC
jgi:hypothetical protein